MPQKGRRVAARVTVSQRENGQPVTLDGVRALPIASLTREAASELREVEELPTGVFELVQRSVSPEDVRKAAEEGPTDRTLALLAYIYRWSIAVGDPPAKTVSDLF